MYRHPGGQQRRIRGRAQHLEPWLGTLPATRKQPKKTAVSERGGGVQDRTHVPLRAGRHQRVHGVVTTKKKRETEQVLREEEHRKTCETCQARGWFSTDPSSTEQDDYRATRGKGANRQDDGGPCSETPVEQVWEAV